MSPSTLIRQRASRSGVNSLLLVALALVAAVAGVQAQDFAASGIPDGGRVQTGATSTLTLTVSGVTHSLTVDVACTSGGSATGLLDPNFLSFAQGETTKTTEYTAPNSEIAIACEFVPRSGSDAVFDGKTATLSFSTAPAPSLTVTGIEPATELIAGSTHTLTLTAVPAVANGALTVTSSCTTVPATFVIENGASTAEVVYTAPDSSSDAVTCTFALAAGGDPYFAGITNVGSVTFSVLKPVLTFSGVTQGATLLTGSQSNLTVTANAPIAGELRLAVLCMAAGNAVLSATVVVPAGETSGFVPFTAPLLAAGSAECKVSPQSGDARFNDQAVTDAVPVIVFSVALPTVTLSGLTEGAQVQAGSTQRITLTVSDVIVIDDLSVNVTCPGVGVSGYFRVHMGDTLSTTTQLAVPINATVGSTFTCTFQYLRGDERYTNAAMPAPLSFSVAPVPVPEPSSSSSTGESGGDSSSTADDSSSAGDASSSSTADAATGSSSTGTDAGSSSSSTGQAASSTAGGSTADSGATAQGSSSTGSADSSSGGDPSGLFSSTAVPCVDSECAGVAHSASGFASLALLVALAAALRF